MTRLVLALCLFLLTACQPPVANRADVWVHGRIEADGDCSRALVYLRYQTPSGAWADQPGESRLSGACPAWWGIYLRQATTRVRIIPDIGDGRLPIRATWPPSFCGRFDPLGYVELTLPSGVASVGDVVFFYDAPMPSATPTATDTPAPIFTKVPTASPDVKPTATVEPTKEPTLPMPPTTPPLPTPKPRPTPPEGGWREWTDPPAELVAALHLEWEWIGSQYEQAQNDPLWLAAADRGPCWAITTPVITHYEVQSPDGASIERTLRWQLFVTPKGWRGVMATPDDPYRVAVIEIAW